MFFHLDRIFDPLRSLRTTISQSRDNVVAQKLLIEYYRTLPQPRDLRDIGFGLYSQNDEDGILLYIFARIGVRHYRCVEICAGDGVECNTANLLINHRRTGLLIDGNRKNIEKAKRFYQ